MVFEILLKQLFGVKSPSEEVKKIAKKNVVKPFKKGFKQAQKDQKKYKAIRKKFEAKWLKKNQSWTDNRHKAKALENAFLKEYPQFEFYVKMERLGRKCKI